MMILFANLLPIINSPHDKFIKNPYLYGYPVLIWRCAILDNRSPKA